MFGIFKKYGGLKVGYKCIKLCVELVELVFICVLIGNIVYDVV